MATDRSALNDYIAENRSLLLRLGDREKEILELRKANTELRDVIRRLEAVARTKSD